MITEPLENLQKTPEEWRKSIPAQVFLNHFQGIDFYTTHANSYEQLTKLKPLQRFKPKQEETRWENAKKWLLNAWNAEYTLRTVALQTDTFYQQHALHWVFPQAYYSLLYSAKAFLAIQGINVPVESVVVSILNGYVQKGWYPKALSGYVDGAYGQYQLHNLPMVEESALLVPVQTPKQAVAHVAQFLRTTRDLRTRALRQRVQANPEKAFRTKSGKVLTKFSTSHWQELANNIGITTLFDALGRLKVSGTQRELERFVEADIDLVGFHRALLRLVEYFNAVHESYVVKAVGYETYYGWLQTLPAYLKDGFVKERLQQRILPVVEARTTVVV